jgi:hypothetical protein
MQTPLWKIAWSDAFNVGILKIESCLSRSYPPTKPLLPTLPLR